jgi:hypothetical protein
MALTVFLAARGLTAFAPWQRLALEVAIGGSCYAGLLATFWRGILLELVGLILRRKPATATVPA